MRVRLCVCACVCVCVYPRIEDFAHFDKLRNFSVKQTNTALRDIRLRTGAHILLGNSILLWLPQLPTMVFP